MRRRGWQVDVVHTEPAGATVGVVRERVDVDRPDVVVYLGGDGTFSEVAKGLLASGYSTPMGMLPAGTANDQGKSFGVLSAPRALEANLDVIEAGFVCNIDVGLVEHFDSAGEVDHAEYVFHSVGFGMQPDVLAKRNEQREAVSGFPLLRELYRDQAVYAGATLERYLASWVEPTKFDAICDLDGERSFLTGLSDIVLNATPVYGGAWVLDRNSRADDGRFEFVPIFGRRDWALGAIRNLAQLQSVREFIGVSTAEREAQRQISEIELWLERPGDALVAAQIDGEEWHAGRHFRLAVLPRALPLLVPEHWRPPWSSAVLEEESDA